MSTNQDWLDLAIEDTLEPDLPICDPHHHLWEFRPDGVAPRYLMDEFQADLETGHNIVATVFIECGAMYKTNGPEALRSIGEIEFANGIAAMSASGMYGPTRIGAGLIGNADLCLGRRVGEVLDGLSVAGGGRFRGIRDQANWDASPDIGNGRFVTGPQAYMEPAFREGFSELANRDLSFEAWCFHHQIKELADLARAYPDTRIVLNHFGGPLGVGPYAGKREEIFASWQGDLALLATCPNVHAKLGGINMDINGFGWHERDRPPTSQALMEATRPYYAHAIDCFGVDRCMFESNFPVDKTSCSYNVLWNAFKRMTADYSADERSALFHDTAMRFYRLTP